MCHLYVRRALIKAFSRKFGRYCVDADLDGNGDVDSEDATSTAEEQLIANEEEGLFRRACASLPLSDRRFLNRWLAVGTSALASSTQMR